MRKFDFFIIFIISIFLQVITIINPVYSIEEHDNHEELFNPPNVKNGSILTVKDCVALAFKNSPKIRRKKYELDIAKSNTGIAKSKFFPVISAGVGFNYERNSDSIYYDKKYRNLPYVSVTVNQLVYDFGKTNADIKMETFYKIGAEYEFVDSICYTLFDIKGKYYSLLKDSALLALAEKNIELNKEILQISQGKADRTTAEVNLTKSEINCVKAKQELQNAKYNLSNAMYLDSHIDFSILSTPTFNFDIENQGANFIPIEFPFKNEEAPDIAYKNSPDLQVIINTKKAMEQSLKYAKKIFLPELTAGVGYGLNHTYETTNNSLQVGAALSTDINLKEWKHIVDKSKAELNIADNEILLFKKDLYYEVQRALNNVDRTKEQLLTSKQEVYLALKNLNYIRVKYKSKELDYTALQNARKDYIKAQETYILSLYNYNMAIIQTEMAMHYHIVDIHHKSEHAIHSHADELLEHLNDALNCDESESKKR